MQHALAGAERVFEVLDTKPDIKDKPVPEKSAGFQVSLHLKT
jgi:ABC-type multidrug transport system fused ATPase/permease subunit